MRKRIIALVLSITCTVGFTAIAASTLRTINVNYGINIEVNGQNQTLTDAGGNKVDPFVYNGTTFVPIRAISEIFGANVDYIPATNTATIDFVSSSSIGIDEKARLNDILNILACYESLSSETESGIRIMDLMYDIIHLSISRQTSAINEIKNIDLPKFKSDIDNIENLISQLSEKSTYINQNIGDILTLINRLNEAYPDMVNAANQLSQEIELLKINSPESIAQATTFLKSFDSYASTATNILYDTSLKAASKFWDFWSIANDLTSK